MHVPWRTPTRVLLTTAALALAAASPASAAIVINEVESKGAGGPDFIEIKNTGAAPVDIGGYRFRDSGANNATQVPVGTTIAAGGYYVASPLNAQLGNPDDARVFDAGDVLVDGYSWADHAGATFGRCADGTGGFVNTNRATPGAANDCPATIPLVTLSAWPGGATIATSDAANPLNTDVSGLAYQASGTSAPGVLWAVRNADGFLFRMVWNGTTWVPDAANGWGAGKELHFPNGLGLPDGEGITLAAGDPNGMYVSTERDDSGAPNVSRPSVLRFDVSGSGATLTATREWALAADLPGLDENGSLEALTWVPDSVLVAKGFRDEAKGADYAPATHPNHGAGLFFVGVELTGQVIAYALNQTNGTYTRIAAFGGGSSTIAELHFEAETNRLWAMCDNTCDGRGNRLEIAQSGPNDGRFVLTSVVSRPSGMPNYNNEGFTIAPQAECVNGLKPAIWADDENDGDHALRTGTVNCTVIPPVNPPGGSGGNPPGGGGGTPTTPTTIPSPPILPGLPPPADKTAPSLRATLKLTSTTRRTGKFTTTLTLGEDARVTTSATAKRTSSAKAATIVKSSSRALLKGTRKVGFTVSKKLRSKLRKGGSITLTVIARDAAGNVTTRRVTAKVK